MKLLQINQIKISNNLQILYNQDKYLNNKSLSNNSHNINNPNNNNNQILKSLRIIINHPLQQTFSIQVYQIQM